MCVCVSSVSQAQVRDRSRLVLVTLAVSCTPVLYILIRMTLMCNKPLHGSNIDNGRMDTVLSVTNSPHVY